MAMEYGLAPPQPAAVASAAVQRALASRAPTASSSYTAHCVSQGQSSRKALPLMEEGAEAVWVVVAKVVVAEDSGLSGRDFVDFRRHRGVGFTVFEGFSVFGPISGGVKPLIPKP